MATTPSPAAPAAPKGVPPRLRWLRVLAALVIREMAARFGRSAGGYLWAIAEPLGGILLLSVAFGLALRAPPLGTNFMLFYATGVIPYYMFVTMSKQVAGAVRTNKGLLNYPVVTALDAVLAKFVLNFLTVALIGAVVMSATILWSGVQVNLDLGPVALSFLGAATLGLGVGSVNCVLFGLFPTWRNFWGVLTRPLLILSGVLYVFANVPPAFQKVLWWNPIVHVVGLMRAGFYGEYDARYVSLPYVFGVGLTLFVIGAYLVRRHADLLLEDR